MNQIHLNNIISDDLAGFRLDQALAKLFPQFSRSQLQQWIEKGGVTVNQKKIIKSKDRVYPGQKVELNVTLENREEWTAEALPLDIVFEDESLLVINKPPGLVVHPGAGNLRSTLVNALLYYDTELQKLPRAGLIHRLDKDTSGLLLIARNLTAFHHLSQQMQQRTIHRSYAAIVEGSPKLMDTINLAIGRHPTQRTKMSVLMHGGRSAVTHFKVLEKFLTHAYLDIELETGRTHQIRVHMAYINHPILGDPVYGKSHRYDRLSEELSQQIADFKRQALHAKKISFRHPVTEELVTLESNLPDDLENLLQAFRKYNATSL
ncbi:MAG: 23S rRNA pseudouridine(1911/1915/1917) synthase RluD [Gammaproteobacteria bacterium]|nr:23S rRNA pseudouridine(1911/1915/1917) synthase RluD [Gammaproteobacteria bacterium]